MAFYRKYRPQVIEEIDNLAVRDRLLSFLTKDKKELPHAFLFSGPRGAGKTTSARLIAKLFNCLKPTKTGPCGTCEQCVSIAQGRNMDVLEIDAASNRGIDEIRQLREAIGLAPMGATTKVYIIDEVHMLTTEAFNALLKTLEEPPAHAVFVLATTDPQKVPATIKSRCVHIPFTRATNEELVGALARIAKDEALDIDTEALTVIATCADGAFRDAVKLLEQVSFQTGNITADTVRGLLAQGDEGTRSSFLTHISHKKTKEALADIAQLVKDGKDMKLFLVDCISELERLLVSQVSHTSHPGLDPGSMSWSQADLRLAIRKLSQAYTELKNSPIAQLPLELAVIEFCDVPQAGKTPDSSFILPDSKKQESSKLDDTAEKLTPHQPSTGGLISIEKLTEHWRDIIEAVKGQNTSIAGVLRSTRPKGVEDGIVVIEAFYSFHKDKLSEPGTKELLASTLKKLFGEKVKVEIVLGKK